jgi:protein-S-isoprenylcysteine O-methyltransferase Ste14
MTTSTQHSMGDSPKINVRLVVVRLGTLVLLSMVLLFGAAGTLNWLMGWAYLLFMLGFSLLSRLHLLRSYPDLAAERAASMGKENVEPWDRRLMPFVAIWGPMLVLLIAGLDRRNGWSPAVAQWVQIAAFGVVIVGYLVGHWATMANRFFSGTVRIQTERGHTVQDAGPYRIVRHPSYAAGVVANPAIALTLGSLWALLPAGLVVAALITRTALEDRMLHDKLPGYAEYAQRTRYRLLPGVW